MKKGWEMKRLGEMVEIINGGTPDTKVKDYWANTKNLWITPKDMGKLKGIYVSDTERKISDEGLKNSSAKLLPINSVILSSRAPIGHLAINKIEMATNQGCKGIIPRNNIDILFLYYFLKKSVKLLDSLGSGATFKELSSLKLSEVEILLPSLEEQHRIVSILDKAFEEIEKVKKLTEENLKNAKEFFNSYLQGVFENKGEDWEEKKLEMVCEEMFAGGDAPKDNLSKDKTDIYTIPIYANAVKERGLYGYTNYARVTKPSITISARGSGTGHTELRNEVFFPIVRLIVIIPNLNLINIEFLKYKIDTLEILKSGSAIPQLTIPMIKEYQISFPSLEKQQKIVQKLNKLSAETKKLETIYQQKLDSLEKLRKSILQKAFQGEL